MLERQGIANGIYSDRIAKTFCLLLDLFIPFPVLLLLCLLCAPSKGLELRA